MSGSLGRRQLHRRARPDGVHPGFLGVQPTCQLLTGIVVSLPWTALGTTASWTVPVPNQPAAVGISFYQQALVLDAGPRAA